MLHRAHGHIDLEPVFGIARSVVQRAEYVKREYFFVDVVAVFICAVLFEPYELDHRVNAPLVKCCKSYVGFDTQGKLSDVVLERLNIERGARDVAVLVHFVLEERAPVQYVLLNVRTYRKVDTEVYAPRDVTGVEAVIVISYVLFVVTEII